MLLIDLLVLLLIAMHHPDSILILLLLVKGTYQVGQNQFSTDFDSQAVDSQDHRVGIVMLG